MKWALFARIGQRFSRFRRTNRSPELREISAEFSTEELAFLEADLHDSDARPEFREQLRENLWALVQDVHAPKSNPGDRH